MTAPDFAAFDNIIEMLRDLMERQAKTFDQAVEQLRKICIPSQLEGALAQFAQLQAELDPANGVVIRGVGAAKPWYPGPRANHVFWPNLRTHLLASDWSAQDVADLDESSNIVLASCQSPWDSKSNGRGLVIGYVQSGKTTNFTAVIAKAADSGFRLIIVMSGLTKSLRKQTQKRLDEQLKELSPNSWIFLTDQDKDFDKGIGMGPVLYHPALRTCVVIKKNKSRLTRLNAFLDAAAKAGQLDNCPILVIDDEGDQASLSPNCDEKRASKINREIVKILNRPRVNYISYTATPFANVFVSPFYEENLYPRDFIYSMPETKGYFGTRLMFGSNEDHDGLDVVRQIAPLEEESYFGAGSPKHSESLEHAIRWFLLAATARRIRNSGVQSHTTMLINASERVQYHFDLWPVVRNIVLDIKNQISQNGSIRVDLERQWQDETRRVPASNFGNVHLDFELILADLMTTIDLLGPITGANHDSNKNCGIIVDNSGAEIRLAYSDEEPRPIIVIGGNTLSRGLTLEGLVCSVFARSTKLYDSLLQMGRWFGYRRGYEDLPRVWMFENVLERFEFLARIENELREEISRYAETGLSPMDFGVRIRLHPNMSITRQAMLKGANKIRFQFSGTSPQTTFLENEPKAIARTHVSTNALIQSILGAGVKPEVINTGTLFRDVDATIVRAFFDPITGYPLSSSNTYFNNAPLCKYIDTKTSKNEITKWNIFFRSRQDTRKCTAVIGVDMGVVNRTRLKSGGEAETFTMGVITDPGDKVVDLPNSSEKDERAFNSPPLLVIYAIDKDSKADKNSRRRRDLNALDDLIALSLFMPISDSLDDLGEFAIVDGPWDIPPIGEADDGSDEGEIPDDEGDAVPQIPALNSLA
jgi:hypothetical protein